MPVETILPTGITSYRIHVSGCPVERRIRALPDGRQSAAVFVERFDEDVIMYDARLDSGHAGGVLARGVLWLGASEGLAVEDRADASRYADGVSSTALLGDAHGPRVLELLNAACG